LHYGRKIESNAHIFDVYKYCSRAFSAQCEPDGTSDIYSEDVLPMEFPCYGSADMRLPAFHARYADGSTVTKLAYKSHSIIKGKPLISGLPAFYVEVENEADTLQIELEDELTGLLVVLSYTVYNERDIITRSVKIVNNGDKKAELLRVMSMNIDMFDNNYATRWTSPNDADNSWAIFDLGEVKKVDAIGLAFWRGDTRNYYYDLFVSTDGENWTPVVEGGANSGTSEGIELEMIGENARFIKFVGAGNTNNGHSNILEFRALQKK